VIEEALLQHPDVAMAAAVGQPDAYAGELPVAFVTLKAGATTGANELCNYLIPIMSESAALPKHVAILPDLPMTPIGKIYKPALRVLATQRAVEDALSRAGLPGEAFRVAASETGTVIDLKNEGDREATKLALLGMPIRYDIRCQASGHPDPAR
jgi:fatty-acyl-CoA synthase